MNNNNENVREQIYLAALLHDIGKFWQRADNTDNLGNSTILKQSVKNNVQEVSRVTQNGYVVHGHSPYTQQFFEDYKKTWNEFFSEQDKDNNLTNLAIYHHLPKTFLQELIQLGDWWSSGMDRQKAYEKQIDDKEFRERPLINIWKNINIYDQNCSKINLSSENCCISLNGLSLDKDKIFPTTNPNTNQQNYQDLWNKFEDEFKNLPQNNYRVFADTLYYLLQKYLWSIPASTLKGEIHDSNLFEHSKTTAAIALCLYDYCQEKKINETKKLDTNHRPVLLVAIDISGIQSFIYNISSKGAAKALKGRSFYLQLLMDTIINEILYNLGYYRSNVLYSSGGKAYLLLPNIEEVSKGLEKYQNKLEEWLFEKFNGDLYVSIGKVAFFFDKDKRDDEGERGKKYLIGNEVQYCYIGDLWKAALDDASKKKNQRFKSVIVNDEKFFEPFGEGGIIEICDLTAVELNKDTKFNFDDYVFHETVGEQIELGRILKNASYFVWTNQNDQSDIAKKTSICNFKNKFKSLEILNSQWFFYSDNSLPTSFDNAIIYKSVQNNFDFITSTIAGNSVKAFKFYAGTSEIHAFEDLINKDANFKRLAAFVMDVDNLGKIFIDGFKEKDNKCQIIRDHSSFSRLSTLSFYLDLFFSGYVNVLKNKYPKIMVVYSGGDDLLAVGDWKEIIQFAEEIRNEFYEFVCNRPEISFSAGVSLFTEKYPISKAVELAKEAESAAKAFNNQEKGNITYLSIPIIWKKINDNEFDNVKDLKDNFVKFYNEGLINSSFIQRFQIFYEAKEQSKKTGNLSYRWNTAYYLKRYEKRVGNKLTKEFSDFLEKIYEDLQVFLTQAQTNLFLSERNYDLYALAARWAELELRSINN